jgi:MraZ protein
MDCFVCNFALRLDAKGRVSRLARFRSVLARDGFEGFYCCPALDRSAPDAGGRALLAEIKAVIARFHLFSNERERFAAALYGASAVLRMDAEGRGVLPEALKTHAGIKDAVAFVGLGNKFQIWDPNRFRSELAAATERVGALKKELEAEREAPKGQGGRE